MLLSSAVSSFVVCVAVGNAGRGPASLSAVNAG
jgi:hypothetical protein